MLKEAPKMRVADADIPVEPEPIPGFARFGAISLQGVYNCRDLGGMPTMDGHRIRKRRLMRSAELHDATAEDMRQLVHMHELEYVVDLRAEYEVESAPDPLPLMQGIEYVNLPVLSNDSIGFSGLKNFGSDMKMLLQFTKDPFQMLEEIYAKCVLGEYGQRAYSRFLNDLLKDSDGATLWHCTQGKDRTGLAAMFVEYALGVPGDYIRADYLATNLFIKPWIDKMSDIIRNKFIVGGLSADIEAYSFANLRYLDAVLGAIRDSYGSLDNYLAKALDFGPDKQAALREMYLE